MSVDEQKRAVVLQHMPDESWGGHPKWSLKEVALKQALAASAGTELQEPERLKNNLLLTEVNSGLTGL